MTVESFLAALDAAPAGGVHLMLPGGEFVPAHFHVTEVGRVQKDFIDCGGTVRSSAACVIQAWVANDVGHRLDAAKLARIIRLAAPLLASGRLPVEVEYGADNVSQYPVTAAEVTPAGVLLHLGGKPSACLAPQLCGVPALDVTGCAAPGCC